MTEEKREQSVSLSRRDLPTRATTTVVDAYTRVSAEISTPGSEGPPDTASLAGPQRPAGRIRASGPARISASTVAESKGYIVYDPELCIGCQTCEVICSSVKNGGKVQPSLSRIKVSRKIFLPTVNNFEPKPCLQCKDPQCMAACPVEGAMYVDETTGARCINEDECIGCRLCMDACAKYHETPRIIFDPEKVKCLKCDLCGGYSQCVKWCANAALKYVGLAELRALGYQQDFWQPYNKDFGPDLVPFEGYKLTFEKCYPYLQGQE